MAEEAYTWLFEELPGHPWWEERKRDGYLITSFLSICELLDLDPPYVRERVKKMTPKQIMTAGRPAEKRRRPKDDVHYAEHGAETVSLESLEGSQIQYGSSYEAHYAVFTPGESAQ